MRLMRHKTADLTMGTYDKVEDTELRRELERLPVANAMLQDSPVERVEAQRRRATSPKRAGTDGSRGSAGGGPCRIRTCGHRVITDSLRNGYGPPPPPQKYVCQCGTGRTNSGPY
jgi:hypothetical protein